MVFYLLMNQRPKENRRWSNHSQTLDNQLQNKDRLPGEVILHHAVTKCNWHHWVRLWMVFTIEINLYQLEKIRILLLQVANGGHSNPM